MLHAISNDEGMFKDVTHALHVAYLVMSTEARQDCTTRAALLKMMEYAEDPLTAAQADWFEELRGVASQSLNFKGLSSDDIRAQCALIVSAVRSKLPAPEMYAMEARFTQTEFEDVKGVRRFAFSREKAAAIQALADWLRPSVGNLPALALDCLVAKQYANHSRTAISYRDLANSFKMSHTTFIRAGTKVKANLAALEVSAAKRLQNHFVQQGILREPEKRA
jgi:hypothetical protein